jgi:hypothetical protein
MHGPDEREALRWGLNRQKTLLALLRDRDAFAHAQRRLQFHGKRIGVDRFGVNKSLLPSERRVTIAPARRRLGPRSSP